MIFCDRYFIMFVKSNMGDSILTILFLAVATSLALYVIIFFIKKAVEMIIQIKINIQAFKTSMKK